MTALQRVTVFCVLTAVSLAGCGRTESSSPPNAPPISKNTPESSSPTTPPQSSVVGHQADAADDDVPDYTKKFVQIADEGFARGFRDMFDVKKSARVVEREYFGKEWPALVWLVTAKKGYHGIVFRTDYEAKCFDEDEVLLDENDCHLKIEPLSFDEGGTVRVFYLMPQATNQKKTAAFKIIKK